MATAPAEQQLRAMARLVPASDKAGQAVAGALAEALDDLARPMRLAVTGQIKRGKSTLVNALTRLPVAATGSDEVTADSWDMVKVGPLGNVVRLVCKPARFNGECSATLPTTIHYDDNAQELTFALRVERGRWKIDMMATIEGAMGGILDEAAAAVVAVAR